MEEKKPKSLATIVLGWLLKLVKSIIVLLISFLKSIIINWPKNFRDIWDKFGKRTKESGKS